MIFSSAWSSTSLTLTMNRPDARNAMSGPMTAALAEQLAKAELDPAVKCVVLTGAGKGFCAGGDVKGMAARGDRTVGDNTIAPVVTNPLTWTLLSLLFDLTPINLPQGNGFSRTR